MAAAAAGFPAAARGTQNGKIIGVCPAGGKNQLAGFCAQPRGNGSARLGDQAFRGKTKRMQRRRVAELFGGLQERCFRSRANCRRCGVIQINGFVQINRAFPIVQSVFDRFHNHFQAF